MITRRAQSAGTPQRRSLEPLLWIVFSAGGVAAALVMPVVLFLFGVAFPLGWLTPPPFEHVEAVLRAPLTRIVLVGVCIVSLFHWGHRFRYTLYDGLQIKHLNEVIAAVCYGGAASGSLAAIYILATL